MAWYGPNKNCGCKKCFIPCGCTDLREDCKPAIPGYFRNMAIEVSLIPDVISWTGTGFYRPCDARPIECRRADELTFLNDRRYIGMSQFNGTYPIVFYIYDAALGEYIETDEEEGCGYYGVVNPTFTVQFQRTENREFNWSGNNPPCHDSNATGTVDINLTFDVFEAAVSEPKYPITVPNFLFPMSEPLIPRNSNYPVALSGYVIQSECTGGNQTNFTGSVNTNDPIGAALSGPSYAGALVIDPLGGSYLDPPGGGLGPGTPPPGVRIIGSRRCFVGIVESYIEYAETLYVTENTPGNCGFYAQLIHGGWKIKRKLIYDGV